MTTEPRRRGRSWVVVALASLAFPPIVAYVVAVVLIGVFGDPQVALDVPSRVLDASVVAVVGALAGTGVGLIAQRRGVALVAPVAAGVVAGLGVNAAIYVSSGGDGGFPSTQIITSLGISAAIFVATQLSGFAVVGAVAVVVIAGGGLVAFIQTRPVEVVLVIEEYTVDESTGECSGVGEASVVAAGEQMVFVDTRTGEEAAHIRLQAGREVGSGCHFELGDPLGLEAVEYGEFFSIDPESGELATGGSTNLEGNRVVIRAENG